MMNEGAEVPHEPQTEVDSNATQTADTEGTQPDTRNATQTADTEGTQPDTREEPETQREPETQTAVGGTPPADQGPPRGTGETTPVGTLKPETSPLVDTNQVVGVSRRRETSTDTPTVSPFVQRDLDTHGIAFRSTRP